MEHGAQHGVVGNDFATELPQTRMPEQDLSQERNMARFSKTKEFKLLKEHLEQRITFYQSSLPDGRSLTGVDAAERASQWVIANAIIGELRLVIQAYENAQTVVEEAMNR